MLKPCSKPEICSKLSPLVFIQNQAKMIIQNKNDNVNTSKKEKLKKNKQWKQNYNTYNLAKKHGVQIKHKTEACIRLEIQFRVYITRMEEKGIRWRRSYIYEAWCEDCGIVLTKQNKRRADYIIALI